MSLAIRISPVFQFFASPTVSSATLAQLSRLQGHVWFERISRFTFQFVFLPFAPATNTALSLIDIPDSENLPISGNLQISSELSLAVASEPLHGIVQIDPEALLAYLAYFTRPIWRDFASRSTFEFGYFQTPQASTSLAIAYLSEVEEAPAGKIEEVLAEFPAALDVSDCSRKSSDTDLSTPETALSNPNTLVSAASSPSFENGTKKLGKFQKFCNKLKMAGDKLKSKVKAIGAKIKNASIFVSRKSKKSKSPRFMVPPASATAEKPYVSKTAKVSSTQDIALINTLTEALLEKIETATQIPGGIFRVPGPTSEVCRRKSALLAKESVFSSFDIITTADVVKGCIRNLDYPLFSVDLNRQRQFLELGLENQNTTLAVLLDSLPKDRFELVNSFAKVLQKLNKLVQEGNRQQISCDGDSTSMASLAVGWFFDSQMPTESFELLKAYRPVCQSFCQALVK